MKSPKSAIMREIAMKPPNAPEAVDAEGNARSRTHSSASHGVPARGSLRTSFSRSTENADFRWLLVADPPAPRMSRIASMRQHDRGQRQNAAGVGELQRVARTSAGTSIWSAHALRQDSK